jgi:hypothetical protein
MNTEIRMGFALVYFIMAICNLGIGILWLVTFKKIERLERRLRKR